MHKVLLQAGGKWVTVFVPPRGGPIIRRGTTKSEAEGSTMGRTHHLLDAPGESLAARPDAAKNGERKQ
jgi:hypothetical protein